MVRVYYKYTNVQAAHRKHLDNEHDQSTAKPRYKPDDTVAVVSTPGPCSGCVALADVTELTKADSYTYVRTENFDGN